MRVLQRLLGCCGSSEDVIFSSKPEEVNSDDLSARNIEKLKTQLAASKHFSFSESCRLEGSPCTSPTQNHELKGLFEVVTDQDRSPVYEVFVGLSRSGSLSSLSDSSGSTDRSSDSGEQILIEVSRLSRVEVSRLPRFVSTEAKL